MGEEEKARNRGYTDACIGMDIQKWETYLGGSTMGQRME